MPREGFPSGVNHPRWRDVPTEELITRYLGGESQAALARFYGVTRRVVEHRLKSADITVRGSLEANRLLAMTRTPEERKLFAEAAHAAVRGTTLSFEKQCKMARGKERAQVHISPYAQLLSIWLSGLGINSFLEKAIGPYNADIATPPVAVEIFGGNWHAYGHHRERAAQRFRYILDQGWNVVIIWVDRRHKPLGIQAAEYVAGFVEQSRRDPSFRGQYRVIWGNGDPVPQNSLNLDNLAHVPSRR